MGIIWEMKPQQYIWPVVWHKKYKTYLFNPADCQSEPKIITDETLKIFIPIQISKQLKWICKTSTGYENNNLYLLGAGFTKSGQFHLLILILKPTVKKYIPQLIKTKKEDLSMKTLRRGLSSNSVKNEYQIIILEILRKKAN
jgi:hypothetical protein